MGIKQEEDGRIADGDRAGHERSHSSVSSPVGDHPLRERPSSHGAMLGETLSDIAKAGAVGTDLLSLMCATCAFREGCMANQMAATGSVALDCVLGTDDSDFGCHHGMRNGEPTKLCAGWIAAKRTPFDVIKAALLTLQDRLSNIPDPDPVRLRFDAWIAEVDPEWKLDNYQWSRLFAQRDSDTHRQAETPESGSVRSMGSAGSKSIAQGPSS